MPATLEALLIVLVFVMPGFITVRTKVPSVGKPEALQITLRSITASLLYLPLWLLAAGDLLELRRHLLRLAEGPTAIPPAPGQPVLTFFMLALVLPIAMALSGPSDRRTIGIRASPSERIPGSAFGRHHGALARISGTSSG